MAFIFMHLLKIIQLIKLPKKKDKLFKITL